MLDRDYQQLPVSDCDPQVHDASSADVTRKASNWVKQALSSLKTPNKPTDDTLPVSDSAKKTQRKYVRYSLSHCDCSLVTLAHGTQPVVASLRGC